jgi:hypothetical protein
LRGSKTCQARPVERLTVSPLTVAEDGLRPLREPQHPEPSTLRRMIQINAVASAAWHGQAPDRKAAMAQRAEYDPNDRASASGNYELLNIFGTPTGETVIVRKGDRLPKSALGYRWRLVEDPASPAPTANNADPALAALPAAA